MKIFLKLLLWSAGFEVALFLVDWFHLPILSDISFYLQEPPLNIAWNYWPDIGNSRIGLLIVPWIFWFAVLTGIFALACIFQRLKFKSGYCTFGYRWFGLESPTIVDRINKNVTTKSRMSPFDMAAWFSLFAPLAAVAITLGLSLIANYSHLNPFSDKFVFNFLGYGFLILIVSFISGIVSLYGIQRHRREISLWIALAGILTSCAAAYMAFIALALSGMGHNC